MGQNLERIARNWTPPTAEEFTPVILPGTDTFPPIDPSRLSLELLYRDERESLRILTGGDASLLLKYRRRQSLREGFDLSLKDASPDEIEIVQFKGAKQEGLRVDQSLNVAKLMADQTLKLAHHPDSTIRWITMGSTVELLRNKEGIPTYNEHGQPRDQSRYQALAAHLGMKWSEQERQYVREIFREPHTPVVVFQVQ